MANPLEYSCLGNLWTERTWRATAQIPELDTTEVTIAHGRHRGQASRKVLLLWLWSRAHVP